MQRSQEVSRALERAKTGEIYLHGELLRILFISDIGIDVLLCIQLFLELPTGRRWLELRHGQLRSDVASFGRLGHSYRPARK